MVKIGDFCLTINVSSLTKLYSLFQRPSCSCPRVEFYYYINAIIRSKLRNLYLIMMLPANMKAIDKTLLQPGSILTWYR